jgi:membrane peptidoglycan carboxypeptidase
VKLLLRIISLFKRAYLRHKILFLGLGMLCISVLLLLIYEMRTSRFQSRYLAQVGKKLTFLLKSGPSKNIKFPEYGPFDIRLGYTKIPDIVSNLTKEGFFVEAQAEISQELRNIIDRGLYAIYHEKSQTGLRIIDKDGELLYSVKRPERVYNTFPDIPGIIIQTILFIENREILDNKYPFKNPAVEWDRFFLAIFEKGWQIVVPKHSAPGGSTIATQLEKYRHSVEGRTRGVKDKLVQMLSASLRAYLDGERTSNIRRSIVLDYINSIPLAALPGYGEVSGLADGLWAWYGLEIADVDRLLMKYTFESAKQNPDQFADTYKKVLSLFLAHRRPSFYLLTDPKNINALTDDYLNLLAVNGLIPNELKEAALKIKLKLKKKAPALAPISFVQRKAANAIRTRLLSITKYKHLYDLDQIDLAVKSTLVKAANLSVTEILSSLKDKKTVAKYGLLGARTLDRGDPAKVIYSVTLYERVKNVNLLRIQADNLDRPFDINEGTRLDLGSTAKLRTLVTYLDIVNQLYDKIIAIDKKQLPKLITREIDPLSRWVIETISKNPQITLQQTLEAAMLREYSANPEEVFFTGGGVHTFENFKKEDNGKVVTVQTALTHSINLPFIRIMRDCVRYYKYILTTDETSSALGKDSRRQLYLAKFADKEGSYFIESFYQKYKERSSQEVLGLFLKNKRLSGRRLGVVFRHIYPQSDIAAMTDFIKTHLPNVKLSDKQLLSIFDEFAPGKFSINDQGYLARVHPLELWVVGYLMNNPGAKLSDVLSSSKVERQDVYRWLLQKKNRHAQDIRIRDIIEQEAFLELFKSWKKVGYPFQSMVPSLASAIGSSGDRPAALAELMGIILNDGVRYPMHRMERLHFAENTPFETILSMNKEPQGNRVLSSEVAAVLRTALRDIVENGTARRVDKVFKDREGKPLIVGGKTGTGDNRYETFGAGGKLLTSRVVNRTATFVFYLGDRFFGTVTAHVQGKEADNYDFTSALAAELLKAISPAIGPMIAGK